MTVCIRKGCVALAEPGGLCAAHGAGYDQHDGSRKLQCSRCRRAIGNGEWYRQVGVEIRHAKACKMKEVPAREKKTA